MATIWNIKNVARVHLPPESSEPGEEQESKDSEMDEEYIEEPENQEGQDDGSEKDEESDAESDAESGSGEEGDSEEASDADEAPAPTSSSGGTEEPNEGDEVEEDSEGDSSDDSSEDDSNSSEDGVDSSESDSSDDSSEDDSNSSEDDGDSSEGGEESSDEEDESSALGDLDSEPDPNINDDGFQEEEDIPELSQEERDALMRAAQQMMQELEDQEAMENLQEISQDIQDKLNDVAGNSGAYLVDPKVVDNFYRVEGGADYAKCQLREGLKDFGSLGVRLRNLFSDRRSRVVQTGLKKGKRISSRDLHRLHTDQATGKMPRVWKKESEGRNLDAAVSIAVDNSWSMNQHNRNLLAERLTMALGTTLQRIRIPFEMMGYTANASYAAGSYSESRDYPVDINVIKTFEERQFDIKRCVFPSITEITPDLDCLRILAPRLLARPEPKKVLFVFTDGEPTAYGYGGLSKKLEASLKAYIQELRDRGVIVFGFGMQADLTKFYGDDFINVDLNHMEEFPRIVMEKLTKLLIN